MNNKLRVLRAERRWSQLILARAVGVSRQTINSIEREKRVPTLKLALRLARVFSKPVEELFTVPDEAGMAKDARSR